MSIRLKWSPIVGSNIDTYKVYRSILGFKTPTIFPFGILAGDTLKLKINSNQVQTVTFPLETTILATIDTINSVIVGAKAYKSSGEDSFYLRPDVRDVGSYVEVFGGTAVQKLGLTNRIISEKSEFFLIGTTPEATTEYEDVDGSIHDFYAISVVDSTGTESKRTPFIQAIDFTGDICVVEGILMDLQGVRRPDIEITARIVTPPANSSPGGYIIDGIISTLSGEDGRFSLPLLQGASVLFEIDRARISDPVSIPLTAYIQFDELDINPDYMFIDRSK